MSQISTYAQSYLPIFHHYQDEYFQRLQTLVNIDSGTGQQEGINKIIDYLKQWLNEIGFTVSLHPCEGFGNNLVARRSGAGSARVLLVGHIDTVYPAGAVKAKPFTIQDGVASGSRSIGYEIWCYASYLCFARIA